MTIDELAKLIEESDKMQERVNKAIVLIDGEPIETMNAIGLAYLYLLDPQEANSLNYEAKTMDVDEFRLLTSRRIYDIKIDRGIIEKLKSEE